MAAAKKAKAETRNGWKKTSRGWVKKRPTAASSKLLAYLRNEKSNSVLRAIGSLQDAIADLRDNDFDGARGFILDAIEAVGERLGYENTIRDVSEA